MNLINIFFPIISIFNSIENETASLFPCDYDDYNQDLKNGKLYILDNNNKLINYASREKNYND